MYSNKVRIFRASAFAAVLCFGLTTVKANEKLTYVCEVKAVAEVAADGSIQTFKKGQNSFLATYIGTKFKIVTVSGEISGPIVGNQSPNALKTTILDKGSEMQSYKVMTIFGPNTSILYIQVSNFHKLTGSNKYTFSGFRWQEFISGTCE
jgi:hypothetical protein